MRIIKTLSTLDLNKIYEISNRNPTNLIKIEIHMMLFWFINTMKNIFKIFILIILKVQLYDFFQKPYFVTRTE